jgi:hypothetical protein
MLELANDIYKQLRVYFFKREIESSQNFLQFMVSKFNIDGAISCKVEDSSGKYNLSVYFEDEYMFCIRSYGEFLLMFIPVGTLTTMTHPGMPSGVAASELCSLLNENCGMGSATISAISDNTEVIEITIPFTWSKLTAGYTQQLLEKLQLETKTNLLDKIQRLYSQHEEELVEMLDGGPDSEADEEEFYRGED